MLDDRRSAYLGLVGYVSQRGRSSELYKIRQSLLLGRRKRSIPYLCWWVEVVYDFVHLVEQANMPRTMWRRGEVVLCCYYL